MVFVKYIFLFFLKVHSGGKVGGGGGNSICIRSLLNTEYGLIWEFFCKYNALLKVSFTLFPQMTIWYLNSTSYVDVGKKLFL